MNCLSCIRPQPAEEKHLEFCPKTLKKFMKIANPHVNHLESLSFINFQNSNEVHDILSDAKFKKVTDKCSRLSLISFKLIDDIGNVVSHIESYMCSSSRPPVTVAIINTDNAKKILVFWKTKESTVHQLNLTDTFVNFHGIVFDDVVMFLVDFLREAVQKDQNALPKNHAPNITIELNHLEDSEKRNLLMSAISKQDQNFVLFLLRSRKFYLDTEYSNGENHEMLPVEFTYNLAHPELMLELIKAGSKFPTCYYAKRDDLERNCDELKTLVKDTEEIHVLLESVGDFREFPTSPSEVEKNFATLLSRFNDFKHCYNTSSNSLMYRAITLGKFDLVEFLKLKAGKSCGAHELEAVGRLENVKVEQNLDETQPVPETHINALIVNSRLDCEALLSEQHKLTLERVFFALNRIEKIRPILEIVAASSGFRIIFDSSHDNLANLLRLGPNSPLGAAFWKKGDITVSAKALFSEDTMKTICKSEKFNLAAAPKEIKRIVGTLMHELAHYALIFAFRNECKPFAIGNDEKFAHVMVETKKNVEANEDNDNIKRIVGSVFAYPESEWPAELAVRPAQLYAEFCGESELEILRKPLKTLFTFYDDVIVKRISDSIDIVKNLSHNASDLSFDDLTSDLKISLRRSQVNFQGQLVELNMIADKETVRLLTKEQICDIFNPLEKMCIGESINPPRFFFLNGLIVASEPSLIHFGMPAGHLNSINVTHIDLDTFVGENAPDDFKDAKNSLENLLERVTKEKLAILQGDSKSGKTKSLQFVAAVKKTLHKTKWIFEMNADTWGERKIDGELSTFFSKNVLEYREGSFEDKMFKAMFADGQVLFFWDDFELEKIHPIASRIREDTENEQWMTLYLDEDVEKTFTDVMCVQLETLTEEESEFEEEISRKDAEISGKK